MGTVIDPGGTGGYDRIRLARIEARQNEILSRLDRVSYPGSIARFGASHYGGYGASAIRGIFDHADGPRPRSAVFDEYREALGLQMTVEETHDALVAAQRAAEMHSTRLPDLPPSPRSRTRWRPRGARPAPTKNLPSHDVPGAPPLRLRDRFLRLVG